MSFFTGKKFFYITFLGSILWIAAFSYLMVWWSTITGNAFSIPPEVRIGRYQKPTVPAPTHTTQRVYGYPWIYPNFGNLIPTLFYPCFTLGDGPDLLGRWYVHSWPHHKRHCSAQRLRRYGCLLLCGFQHFWCNSWVSEYL